MNQNNHKPNNTSNPTENVVADVPSNRGKLLEALLALEAEAKNETHRPVEPVSRWRPRTENASASVDAHDLLFDELTEKAQVDRNVSTQESKENAPERIKETDKPKLANYGKEKETKTKRSLAADLLATKMSGTDESSVLSSTTHTVSEKDLIRSNIAKLRNSVQSKKPKVKRKKTKSSKSDRNPFISGERGNTLKEITIDLINLLEEFDIPTRTSTLSYYDRVGKIKLRNMFEEAEKYVSSVEDSLEILFRVFLNWDVSATNHAGKDKVFHPAYFLHTWAEAVSTYSKSRGFFRFKKQVNAVVGGSTIEDVFQSLPQKAKDNYEALTVEELISLLREKDALEEPARVNKKNKLTVDKDFEEAVKIAWNLNPLREYLESEETLRIVDFATEAISPGDCWLDNLPEVFTQTFFDLDQSLKNQPIIGDTFLLQDIINSSPFDKESSLDILR